MRCAKAVKVNLAHVESHLRIDLGIPKNQDGADLKWHFMKFLTVGPSMAHRGATHDPFKGGAECSFRLVAGRQGDLG